MQLLFDTGVVLDTLLAREPFVTDSAALWHAHDQGRLRGTISPVTPVNVFYVVRRLKGRDAAVLAVDELLRVFPVCALDDASVRAARTFPMADFEDAVQAAAAQAAGLDGIVIRNGSDYVGSPVPVLTPAQALALLPPETPAAG